MRLSSGVARISILALLALAQGAACSSGAGSSADLTWQDTRPQGDVTGVVVTIESPADGEWRNQPAVLVTGRVLGGDSGFVQVNGTAYAYSEGRYSAWLNLQESDSPIVVIHPESGATASVTIHMDLLPPVLETGTPTRGAVVADASEGIELQFSASDEYGLSLISAAGVSVQPDASSPQAVSQLVQAVQGLNLVAAEATDSHQNLAREHRAVLAGPFVPCQQLASSPTAMMVLGNQALEVLGAAASAILADFDFSSYLNQYNPLYSSESFVVTVETLTLADPMVSLTTDDAQSGRLSVLVQAEEIHAAGTILLTASGTLLDFDVAVWGLALSARAMVSLSESEPKTVDVELQEIITQADSITLKAKDQQGSDVVPPTEVSGSFLDAVGAMAAQFARTSLAEVLAGVVPPVSGTQEVQLLGLPIRFTYSLLDLSVVPQGLSMTLAASGEAASTPLHSWTHGCLGPLPQMPEAAEYEGIQIWLSYPFLNSVFLSAWQQGLTDFVIDQARMDAWKSQITLVCGMLGSLVDAASPQKAEAPLVVDIVPSLPPVVSTSTTLPGGLELSLGDLQLAFRCGTDPTPVASAYLSLELGTVLTVTGGRIQVGLAIDRFLVDMEGLTPQAKRRSERELEVFFEQTIQQVAGALAGSLVSFDSPGAYGLVPVAGTVGAGVTPGWLTVQAMVGMEVAP